MVKKSPQPPAFMSHIFFHKKSVQCSFDQYAVIFAHNLHVGQQLTTRVINYLNTTAHIY